MARRTLMGAVVVALVATAHAIGPTPAPTGDNMFFEYPEDPEASKYVSDKTAELCVAGFVGRDDLADESDDRRAKLEETVGGDNIIRRNLENANSQEELIDNLQTEMMSSDGMIWLGMRCAPIILLLISLVVYFFCFWTCCPCCKCCRCCAKVRKTNFMHKIIGACLYGGIVCGMLLSASVASAGLQTVKDGLSNFGCTSVKFANNTFNGKTDSPYFIGLLPLLEEFDGLISSLDSDSDFMEEVVRLIDSTVVIDYAVSMTSQTIQLLADSLNRPENLSPSAPGLTLLHSCTLCAPVSDLLSTVSGELDASIAPVLVSTRKEVKTQLTGVAGAGLTTQMDGAAEPVVEVKAMIRQSFVSLLQDGAIQSLEEQLEQWGLLVVLLLICWAFFVALCGGLGCLNWILCPKGRDKQYTEEDLANKQKKKRNPYGKWPYRCACLSWCCAFPLLWVTLLVSGILVMLATSLSGLCLILDDLSGDMIKDMTGALNLSLDNTSMFDMVGSIVDDCFNPSDRNYEKGNFLDILKMGNGTFRTEVIAKTKSLIVTQFDSLTSTMSQGTSSLTVSDLAPLIQLRATLVNNPIPTWIIPEVESSNLEPYARLALPDSPSALEKFPVTSLACGRHVVVGMGDLPAVPGIEDFDAALAGLGAAQYNPSVNHGYDCGVEVTCSNGADEICQKANAYIQQKNLLTGSKGCTTCDARGCKCRWYRCDLFEKPGNPSDYCDPKDMTGSTATGYSNDCMSCDGDVCTMKQKERFCSLEELSDYVRDFDTRLDKVFKRLDDAVAQTIQDINEDMRELVETTFIGALDRFERGAGCGFLGKLYREIIDGLCYQGIWGMVKITEAYIGLASMIICLIVVMYALWRRTIDNRNKWKPEVLL